MDNKPVIKGRPPNPEQTRIKEHYLDSICNQPGLMNDVAKQLLSIELAVPGIYIAALKLSVNSQNPFNPGYQLYAAMMCWLIALLLMFLALLPGKFTVNPDDHTEIRDSFYQVAKRKYQWIGLSMIAFIFGLFFALLELIS